MKSEMMNRILERSGARPSSALGRLQAVLTRFPVGTLTILAGGCFSGIFFMVDERAQGDFQNLGFESATLVAIPNDRYGQFYADAALPGWVGSVGTNSLVGVLHNSRFLAVSGGSILDSSYASPLQGNFSVFLDAGVYPDIQSVPADVSLSQIGIVPMDARSLQFLARSLRPGSFAVSVGGVNLSLLSSAG